GDGGVGADGAQSRVSAEAGVMLLGMLLYRALLHLYPASFRAEYGEDLCAMFARRRDQAGSNPFSLLALWLGAIADIFTSAPPVHFDILRGDLAYTLRTLRRVPGFAVTPTAVGGGRDTPATPAV